MYSEDPIYRKAVWHRTRREFGDARKLFRECANSAQTDDWGAFFLCRIAECFSLEGKMAEAIQTFREACDLDPSPLSLMAWAEFQLSVRRDRDAARSIAERAIDVGDNYRGEGFSAENNRKRICKFIESISEE